MFFPLNLVAVLLYFRRIFDYSLFLFVVVVKCLCKLSESGFTGFKDLQDELGVTHLNVQSLMNRATTRVAPTVLCRDVKRDAFELNVAFYDGDFFSRSSRRVDRPPHQSVYRFAECEKVRD